MLVCPACRGENDEDAKFCTSCGRSLSPEETPMARVARQEPPDDEMDMPPAPQRSPVVALAAVVGLVLLAGAAATWWALRPNPCEGKFSSQQFPYCVEVPQGWQESQETIQGSPADAFASPTFDPVVLVFAEEGEPGLATEALAESQRAAQEENGVFPGPMRPVDVGGTPAVAWEFTNTVDTGDVLRYRNVVLVRGGTAWTIQFLVERDRFSRAVTKFERMLESWAWK
ncbi:MAG TPA: hypothetical protein VHL78_10320 [Actinomycetota bacterium]|nr:hypothetical protein [Actinomycetota bacterium]